MFKSSPDGQQKRAALQSFLERAEDGALLKWKDIEAHTKVKMDSRGRDMVRSVLDSLKRPCDSVWGVGVQLSSADTALVIMGKRFVAIDNSVKKADKTQHELATRHLSAMTDAARNRMLMLGSFFGAIRSIAESAKDHLLVGGGTKT